MRENERKEKIGKLMCKERGKERGKDDKGWEWKKDYRRNEEGGGGRGGRGGEGECPQWSYVAMIKVTK